MAPITQLKNKQDSAADNGASNSMAVLVVAANIGNVRLIDNLRSMSLFLQYAMPVNIFLWLIKFRLTGILPFDLAFLLWHFRRAKCRSGESFAIELIFLKDEEKMLCALAIAISLSLMNFFQVATPPALAGDTLIKCKIKGVGIRNFKLEDGIWSDKVWGVRIIRAGKNGVRKPTSRI